MIEAFKIMGGFFWEVAMFWRRPAALDSAYSNAYSKCEFPAERELLQAAWGKLIYKGLVKGGHTVGGFRVSLTVDGHPGHRYAILIDRDITDPLAPDMVRGRANILTGLGYRTVTVAEKMIKRNPQEAAQKIVEIIDSAERFYA